jgi:hypothetical protein
MIHGTSIKIFLADGTPDGFKVVEKSNWTGKAIVCSRAQFPSVKKHEVFSRTGVYLLIGTDDSNDLPKAYIGEGDPVLQRLESHERNKEFWETMIVFTSKDQNLNKAHIQYIESRLVEIARAAKRCILDNGNSPTQPALSEAEVADIEAFLSEMRLVYSVLGVKIFDIPEVTSEVIATGQDKPEGFIVMKGSHCLKKESPSFPKNAKLVRASLQNLGVLASLDSESFVFSQDYVFNSPSQAAYIILGRPANGRTEWKLSDGKTLKEFQENQSEK